MIGLSAFLAGLAFLAATLACVLIGAALIVRRRLAELRGSALAVAYALVATTLLLAVHMVPGALGVLSRGTVLAAAVLALVACRLVPAARHRTAPSPAPPAPPARPAGRQTTAAWIAAIVAVAVAGGYALAYLRHHYAAAPTGIDALSFHLPDVARWIQTGTFWEIDQFLPQLAQGNYPNSGDVVFLAVVLPFKSALLVRWAMVPFLALTGVVVYALGRELGAPRAASVLFGAAVTTVPAVMDPALVSTQTDTLMLFAFGAGVLFLLRHRRTGARRDLVLAGLGLGIAFGTKWYGVTCVAAVLAVWVVASRLAGTRWRDLGAQALALVALVTLAGGFWLVRNLVESADPFFPARVRLAGVTIFNAPPDVVRQTGGFTIANYLGNAHVLRVYILPALLHTLGWLSLLLGLAALAAAGFALVRRRPQTGLIVTVAAAAVLVAIVYTITPETALGPRNFPVQTNANTRYLVPALVLAAPLAAWLSGRLGRWGLLLEAGVLALMLDALSRLYGLRSGLALALAFVIAAAGLVALLRPAVLRRRPLLPNWKRTAAAAALLTLLAVAGAFATRRAYDARGYASDATVAWVLQHAPSGHRIGLAGVWSNGLAPIWPAFGPRLGNRVAYVGPFVRHMLEQYPSPGRLASALRGANYDLLIVGRGFPRPQPSVPSSAAALAAGYRQVAASPRLLLYAR